MQKFNELKDQQSEIEILIELNNEGENGELDTDIVESVSLLLKKVEKLELESTLSGEDDSKDALLTIHAGAGGTEGRASDSAVQPYPAGQQRLLPCLVSQA